MSTETIETLVIGAGQAGIAISEHLRAHQLSHVVLERSRIAESWRSARWDSLVANGPAWHDRFPGMEFDDIAPGSFATKTRIVDYFMSYADKIEAPIRTGIDVTLLEVNADGSGFRAHSAGGVIEARNVVLATGPFQKPVIPAMVPDSAGILQIHSNAYRNPGQLPSGAVLVVGAGSSGAQIADELLRSGKRVYLSVGPHNRPPRSYRQRDFCWWLGAFGLWDAKTPSAGVEHVTIAVSGANGGHTVDFRELASRGMVLLGRTEAWNDGTLTLKPDLSDNIAAGDADYLSVLDAADAYISREGLDLPEEPDARIIGPDPACITDPILQLDLAQAAITSIIWATGYVQDFSWVKAGVFDDRNKPAHRNGVTAVPGLYFLGLPWLSRRASPFIWGVWHDAKYLAEQIKLRATPPAIDMRLHRAAP